MDRQVLKTQIKAAMFEYLQAKGWPDRFKGARIINDLPNLWKMLESKGLLKDVIPKGFTYKNFVDSAIMARQRQQLKEEMAKRFGFRF